MKVVAVTGTNGKTTVVFWVFQFLGAIVGNAAYIGTLGAKSSAMSGFEATGFTTPDDNALKLWLERFEQENCSYLAIEASSHGLKQRRLRSLNADIAVFMNLTRDHLDYHSDMNDYFESKALLFSENNLQAAVVNADDQYGQKLIERLNNSSIKLLTFGCAESADVRLIQHESVGDDWRVTVDCQQQPVTLKLKKSQFTATSFNLSNLLAVISVAYVLEYDLVTITEQLQLLEMPRGRLQPVDCGQPFNVYVDFAHTPDALDTVLSNLKAIEHHRLIVVFGCGGDRDRGKRPLMTDVATKYADVVIATSDNPRSEPPATIIDDMLLGIDNKDIALIVEVDRKLAIQRSLSLAEDNDIVLIAGKGHETTQEVNGVYYPFDDVQVAENYLNQVIGHAC